MLEVLQKILSRSGIASRRQAEKLILKGQVKINGRLAQLGDRADVSQDKITVNNKIVETRFTTFQKPVYYLVNKPIGYICTTQDKHAEKLITSLVPPKPKVWPVGRLDKDSTGLIILTNDGDLTYQLTHPRYEHEKEPEQNSTSY